MACFLAWSWWKRCGGSVGFALSRNAFLAFLSCTIFTFHPLGRGPIRVWRCLGVDVTHIESRFEFGETLHSKRHRKAFAPPGSNRKCTFSPENDKSFCHACQSQLMLWNIIFQAMPHCKWLAMQQKRCLSWWGSSKAQHPPNKSLQQKWHEQLSKHWTLKPRFHTQTCCWLLDWGDQILFSNPCQTPNHVSA